MTKLPANIYHCGRCGEKFSHPEGAMDHHAKCQGVLVIYVAGTTLPDLSMCKPGEVVVLEGAVLYMAPNGEVGFPWPDEPSN